MRLPPFPVFPYSGNMPDFYRNEQSEEAVVAKLCEWMCKLQEYVNDQTENVNEVVDAYDELKSLFEKFMESGFDDYYKEQICQWVSEHMPDILACSARFVWFDIDEEGYFNAHIPENWQFLQFGTILEQGSADFGKLTLTWDNSVYSNPCICC